MLHAPLSETWNERVCQKVCQKVLEGGVVDGVIGAKAVNRALRSSIEVVRDRRVLGDVSEGVSVLCVRVCYRVC